MAPISWCDLEPGREPDTEARWVESRARPPCQWGEAGRGGSSRLLSLTRKASWYFSLQTMKPCQEGNKVWVSWTQTFNINVTKELLKKVNFHKITLRLWDTTDRISKKIRFYRIKTSTYSDDGGSFGESGIHVLF